MGNYAIDELLERLWSKVPLTPELFKEHGGSLVNFFGGNDDDPEAALHNFIALMDSIKSDSKETAALSAVFGANSPLSGIGGEDDSIDQRLHDAAAMFGKESSRSARRWAKSAIDELATHLYTAFGSGVQTFFVSIEQAAGGKFEIRVVYLGNAPRLPHFVLLNDINLSATSEKTHHYEDDYPAQHEMEYVATLDTFDSLLIRWFSMSYAVQVEWAIDVSDCVIDGASGAGQVYLTRKMSN